MSVYCLGRSPKLGFEGGQTPLRLRIGKRGFTNPYVYCLHPFIGTIAVSASWTPSLMAPYGAAGFKKTCLL